MDYLEAVLQLQGCRMCAQPQVVVVAIQLRLVSIPTRKLIHRREFQVAFVDVVVHHSSRHVQETVFARAVAVKEIVAQTSLQASGKEVAELSVAAPEVIVFVYLLSFSKADVHPIGFCGGIPSAV